jgi:cell wall-associated NlpC family hydrolase
MRKLVVLIVLIFGFGALFAIGAVVALITSTGQQQNGSANCVGPWSDTTSSGQQSTAALNPAQTAIVQQIISIGRQRNLPARAWQVAIQAGMTESHLTNTNSGDLDSLGIFQMRPSMGWGNAAQLSDVPYEINEFYTKLVSNVPHYQQMLPGDAAQAVERSAFPLRYQQWTAMAANLVTSNGAVQDVSGCQNMPPASVLAQQAIAFALGQLGKPYVWGATGPASYDCSGLVQSAWQAAGVSIPRNTQTQYDEGGQRIPLSQAQPGDLVFWGYGRNPQAVHHVALYLGNNEIVQAPQTGQNVERVPLWDGGQLMPFAVRPVPNGAVLAAAPSTAPAPPGVLPGAAATSENGPTTGRRGGSS